MKSRMMLAEAGRTPAFRGIAALTLIAVAFIACQGCVRLRVTEVRIQPPGEQPSVSMRLYLKKPASDQMDRVLNGATTTLFCKNPDGTFARVSSSQMGSWTLRNAMPGTYRVEVGETVMIDGKAQTVRGGRTMTFNLGGDERAEIQAVLKQTPTGLIVVLAVILVVVVLVALVLGHDGRVPDLPKVPGLPMPPGLPLPPLPKAVPVLWTPKPPRAPLPLLLAPPPVFVDGTVFVAASPSRSAAPATAPPEVTRFFPTHESRGVPAQTVVAVWFSAPVNIDPPSAKGGSALSVTGSVSGSVAGLCSYSTAERMLEFYPAAPLAPGEAVRVNLSGHSVRDERGVTIPCDYEWSFEVAR